MIQGTTPAGVPIHDEAGAARYVRQMFARVAPRYDLVNHILSFEIDRYWRRFTVDKVRGVAERADARLLDLCCGTGDLLVAMEKAHGRPVLGVDFCRPMLTGAAEKLKDRARLVEADVLSLPFAESSFDLITIAFGLRNLVHYEKGLAEMRRLLHPGGRLAVLEFSQPEGVFLSPLYSFYFHQVLPLLGGAISGAGGAYRYLQQSVDKFLSPDALSAVMLGVGFQHVQYWRLTGGIAVLHLATK